jgi:DNA-binding XRE family transcriptional regulator
MRGERGLFSDGSGMASHFHIFKFGAFRSLNHQRNEYDHCFGGRGWVVKCPRYAIGMRQPEKAEAEQEVCERLRMAAGITQEQLAFAAHIDLTYVGGIERGRRNPSVIVLARIANALATEPAMLLQR